MQLVPVFSSFGSELVLSKLVVIGCSVKTEMQGLLVTSFHTEHPSSTPYNYTVEVIELALCLQDVTREAHVLAADQVQHSTYI